MEPKFSNRQLWQFYLAKDYDLLSDALLDGWQHFQPNYLISDRNVDRTEAAFEQTRKDFEKLVSLIVNS